MRKEDLSRQRKVGFGDTILIILNKTDKGLNAAIRAFRETVKKENESYSKQAFSKGRTRIKWQALKEIFGIQPGSGKTIQALASCLYDTLNGILLSNIFDDDFTPEDFKELYHLRWGIETKYDDVKNKLKSESFSGTGPLAIRQDFFATMFLNNLASIMIAENANKRRY